MKNNLLYSLLFLFVSLTTFAQTKKVTGKVTSADDGSSLPGVGVQVKGTTKGTQTNIDGDYSIDVPANATLTFSYIGMETQNIAVGNKSTINVSLANDSKQLSEVVVTAIGIQREKKALAYAVSSVSADQLQQKSEPDALRALNGKVPGVNIISGGGAPGQGTRITIRGNNSFTGNNQPLFVVDGIPFDNSVNATDGFASNSVTSNRGYDIDPNNIESMTILKGAAASALYGSRAANGVVVITTKAGSKSARKGLEVTYNTSYSTEKISTIPDYQDTYTQGSNQTYNGGFIGNWGSVFPSEVDRVNAALGFERYSKVIDANYPAGQVPHPLTGVAYGAARYRSVFPELMNGTLPVGVELVPHDIIGGFFQQGSVFENGVNIRSTGDKTTISAGASHMNNKGIIPNSGAGRTSLNFGGNATLANGIGLSGNVNYVNTTQNSPQSGASYFSDYVSGSSGSIYDRLFYLPRNYNLNAYPSENPVTGDNVFYRALDNPLRIAKYNQYTSDVNRVFGNLALTYDPTSWLNLTAKGGFNTYDETRRNVIRPGGVFNPDGSTLRRGITNTELDFTYLATATKDFNEKFNARLMLGANFNQRERSIAFLSGNVITDPNLLTVGGTNTQFAGENFLKRRLYGYFGELNLGYNNYAFLSATLRNDHSSTLPKANNSYFYPSVSGSFIFTDAFKLPSTVLSFGKLRANYATVGKDADPYSVSQALFFNTNSTYYNAQPVPSVTNAFTLNNAELKPEFTTEFELGTELQFFKNRIGLDVAYFDRKSTDLIVSARIPQSTGFGQRNINAGEITNRGWEVGLNLVPVKMSNGFTWNSFVAFTRLRSNIVDAGPAGEIFLGGTGLSSLGTIHRNGNQFGQIYGSRNARSAEGALLISPDTGLPILNPNSEIIGNPNPDYTVGWTNTISFKGFNLSALVDYRHGGDMFSATAASLILRGQLKMSEDREGMRVVPGILGDPQTFEPLLSESGQQIPNTIPMTAFAYHFSDGFGAYGADETNMYDITTLRLREVTLGYSVPTKFLKKNLPFIGGLNVSLSGRNLWFIAPNMLTGLNFDPEVLSSFPDSNVQGFDLGAAPSTRRFGANLSVSF
jgi:TonB-linked SusC/RagA family outer membrane protein